MKTDISEVREWRKRWEHLVLRFFRSSGGVLTVNGTRLSLFSDQSLLFFSSLDNLSVAVYYRHGARDMNFRVAITARGDEYPRMFDAATTFSGALEKVHKWVAFLKDMECRPEPGKAALERDVDLNIVHVLLIHFTTRRIGLPLSFYILMRGMIDGYRSSRG